MGKINPLIALSGTSLDNAGAVRGLTRTVIAKKELNRRKEVDADNREAQEVDIALKKFNLQTEREKARQRDVFTSAAGFQASLTSRESAIRFLEGNKIRLGGLQADGKDVDTNETDEALRILRSGDQQLISQLIEDTNNLVKKGTLLGFIPAAPETFATNFDDQGNPISQTSSTTGKVFAHPNAEEDDVKSDARQAQDLELKRTGPPKEDGDNGGALKASGRISQAVASFYGGIYHPLTQTFSLTDKDLRKEALSVAALAEQIFRDSKGKLGAAEAVEQASEQYNANRNTDPDPDPDSDDDDPDGILKWLFG